MKTKMEDIVIDDVEIVENVRTEIKDNQLVELMQSIKQHGLEQPIGVGKDKNNKKYVLIYGHRRLEACRKLGWNTIPAVVNEEPSMKDLLILNVIENIQRKDITPGELGRICDKLQKMELTPSEIAARLNIEIGRVKSAMQIYSGVPKKIRDRVVFMGGKGNSVDARKGNLPASIVNKALSLRRGFKLSTKQFEDFLTTCSNENITGSQLEIIAGLVKQGLSPAKALKEAENYQNVRIDLVVEKNQLESIIKKTETTATNIIQKVLYGELKPFKKPDFIKL